MTFTQQGISITSTFRQASQELCVEVKIPSAVGQPRNYTIDTKDLSIRLIAKRWCFHDIALRFQLECTVDKSGNFPCDSPIELSYADEFYHYSITLQPSFYATHPLRSVPFGYNKTNREQTSKEYSLHSRLPIPYSHTNISRPYHGGRASPK